MVRPEDVRLPPSPTLLSPLNTPEMPPASHPILPLSPKSSPRSIVQDPLIPSPPAVSDQPTSQPRTQPSVPQGHFHSPSSMSSLAPMLMQRAHSSPGVDSTGRFIVPNSTAPRRPSSPLGFSSRRRSPLRSSVDEANGGLPMRVAVAIEPNIPENAELVMSSTTQSTSSTGSQFDLTPSTLPHSNPLFSVHHSVTRTRRPSSSPLHQSLSTSALQHMANSPSASGSGSGSTSPLLAAQRYANEPYPNYLLSATSSVPSTPTSLRSRSPSISSLETIEDSPDAEEAAILEAEEMARFKAAAATEEGEEREGGELRRRSSLELRSVGFGIKEKRKRWSVSGAERRADFSLEPIEE